MHDNRRYLAERRSLFSLFNIDDGQVSQFIRLLRKRDLTPGQTEQLLKLLGDETERRIRQSVLHLMQHRQTDYSKLDERLPSLTATERKVACLVLQGKTHPEIARELLKSPSNVSVIRSNIRRKMGLGPKDNLAECLRALMQEPERTERTRRSAPCEPERTVRTTDTDHEMIDKLNLSETTSQAERQRRYIFFYTCAGYMAGILWSFFSDAAPRTTFYHSINALHLGLLLVLMLLFLSEKATTEKLTAAVSRHHSGRNILRDDLRSGKQKSHCKPRNNRKHGPAGPAADDIHSKLLQNHTLPARRRKHRHICPMYVPCD